MAPTKLVCLETKPPLNKKVVGRVGNSVKDNDLLNDATAALSNLQANGDNPYLVLVSSVRLTYIQTELWPVASFSAIGMHIECSDLKPVRVLLEAQLELVVVGGGGYRAFGGNVLPGCDVLHHHYQLLLHMK